MTSDGSGVPTGFHSGSALCIKRNKALRSPYRRAAIVIRALAVVLVFLIATGSLNDGALVSSIPKGIPFKLEVNLSDVTKERSNFKDIFAMNIINCTGLMKFF